MAHSDHEEFREEFHGEHPQTYDHTEPKYSIIAILGTVTVVMLIIVAIGIQFYYERIFETQTYNKVLSQENWNLQDLRNKENWELSNYGYLDKNAGTVRIPIDVAKQQVIQEAAEGRPSWPTAPYAVKSAAQTAANPTGVSQPGAAAANAAQNQGATSSPNAQQQNTPPQPPR